MSPLLCQLSYTAILWDIEGYGYDTGIIIKVSTLACAGK